MKWCSFPIETFWRPEGAWVESSGEKERALMIFPIPESFAEWGAKLFANSINNNKNYYSFVSTSAVVDW